MDASTAPRMGRPVNQELRERRREEILDAAVKLFARGGYGETDTQALADSLQIGKGTIYRYFPSKEALFLAAVDRGMHRAGESIDASLTGLCEPLEIIRAAVNAYLNFFDRHPEIVELLIQERAHFKDRKQPTYFEHREANIGRWQELFRSLIAAGRVRDLSPARITDVTSDLLYGAMFTNYFAGRRRPLSEQADDILDLIFNGILSEGERRQNLGRRPEADHRGEPTALR